MRRLNMLILLALMTFVSLGGMLASTAGARWGPHKECYRDASESHHCYAVEAFEMSGYPREYADGAVADQYTAAMNIPGWESGDFVTNELWVSFPGNQNYLEDGQMSGGALAGGAAGTCCALHPFYAETTNGNQYGYESPNFVGGANYNYYEIYDPCHCGLWGIWWENYGDVRNYSQYPAWNIDEEAGIEVGANKEPIEANGKDHVASVEPPSDLWTEWKSGFGNTSHPFTNAGAMCLARNQDSPYWGNINYAVCYTGPNKGAVIKPSEQEPATPSEAPDKPISVAVALTLARNAGAELRESSSEPLGEARQTTGSLAATQAVADPQPGGEQQSIAPNQIATGPTSARETELAEPTTLVVMHGHFINRSMPVKHGDSAIKGTTLGVVVNLKKGVIVGRYVGSGTPQMNALPLAAAAKSGSAVTAVAGRHPTRRNGIEGRLFHGEPSPGHRANYHPQVAAGWLVRAYRRALGERPLATTRTGPRGGFWLALNAGRYLVAGVRPDGSSCPGTFVRVGQHPASVSLGCGK